MRVNRPGSVLAIGLAGFLCSGLMSQVPPSKGPATTRPGRGPRLRERERQFQQMLENSMLKGTWQMTGEAGLAGKAPLTAAREDKYTIDKVSKASEDYWIINARVQYAEKDVTIPVTVRVVWAEDTPIITLDKMALPGLGTYSARVMIYRNFYCGTWFGTNYGGVMSGQIVKQDAEKSATTQPNRD